MNVVRNLLLILVCFSACNHAQIPFAQETVSDLPRSGLQKNIALDKIIEERENRQSKGEEAFKLYLQDKLDLDMVDFSNWSMVTHEYGRKIEIYDQRRKVILTFSDNFEDIGSNNYCSFAIRKFEDGQSQIYEQASNLNQPSEIFKEYERLKTFFESSGVRKGHTELTDNLVRDQSTSWQKQIIADGFSWTTVSGETKLGITLEEHPSKNFGGQTKYVWKIFQNTKFGDNSSSTSPEIIFQEQEYVYNYNGNTCAFRNWVELIKAKMLLQEAGID